MTNRESFEEAAIALAKHFRNKAYHSNSKLTRKETAMLDRLCQAHIRIEIALANEQKQFRRKQHDFFNRTGVAV